MLHGGATGLGSSISVALLLRLFYFRSYASLKDTQFAEDNLL